MNPAISVVIVVYGQRAVTERGLVSLQAALGGRMGDDIELVLIDNASPDDTGDLLDAWADRATIVRNPVNRNFSGGCNDGARAATGDVLVFLNNDMEFVAGAVEAVADTASEPDVGAAGARLLFPDGTIQHAGVIWGANQTGPAMPLHVFHHEAGDMAAAQAVVDLDAVTGACLAIRRQLFLELGGFDENYVNGLEDIDLCLRVRSRGLRIVYRGDICLVHHESVTRGINLEASAHNDHVFQTRWGAATGPDDELAHGTYGGRLTVGGPIRPIFPDWNDGGDVAVEGHLRSIAPEAGEARAILVALEAAGVSPCAREWIPARLIADLSETDAVYLDVATGRWRSPRALKLEVLSGSLYDIRRRHGDILRLASAPRNGAHLDGVSAVWASTRQLAANLIDQGLAAQRVGYLPSPILPGPLGLGGGGLIAVLPGHDPIACAAALPALGGLPNLRVRLLPNVSTPVLSQLVRELAPAAELLAPITSEARFGELAGEADAVICLDLSDEFGRQPLIAAAAGAAISADSGPAADVLGSELLAPGDDLVATVTAMLERAAHREARRRTVLDRCSPASLAPELQALVQTARSAGSGISSRLSAELAVR